MAERRMFAKTIVTSDAFLDMPMSARCLYFTLGMFADDDGFVNNPKGIMRQCGASQDDLNVLMFRKFVIPFERSGIIVIKHWRINNYLRNDRYTETKHLEEKRQLAIDSGGIYHLNDGGIPVVYQAGDSGYTRNSIGKDSIGKIRKDKRESVAFSPPTPEEVFSYAESLGCSINEEPCTGFPVVENPHVENPHVENQTQQSTNIHSTNKQSTNIYPPKSPQGEREYPDGFEEFWDAYPKKKDKHNAVKSFKKIKVGLPTIMSALSKFKESEDWNRDGGKYIPYPSTWLNGRRWEDFEDEPTEPKSSGGELATV